MNTHTCKGTIAVLTGGGDVPGLNPAIRAVTVRALQDGYNVIGIRNGWEGLINIHRDRPIEEQEYVQKLDRLIVKKIGRRGGTFLHSARTNPLKVKKRDVPDHLTSEYTADVNDLTPEVLKNLEYLGVTHLIPIGGDDTLSYADHMSKQGFKVIAIPKTMDNDIPGTDYCLGFSTCLTRTIEFATNLRTCAGSHERILVMEVFGRYAGFTALLPTVAGAADRCIIPEHKFDIKLLTKLLVEDRREDPSKYSVVLVSEGAMFDGGDMIFSGDDVDGFGHKKLGGIGDVVATKIRELSAEFNNGKKIDIINQRLGYLVRSGDPDAIDSLVGTAYGNLALDLIAANKSGRMVCMRNGRYESVPIGIVTSCKKLIDVERFYDTEKYRPKFRNLADRPMWIVATE